MFLCQRNSFLKECVTKVESCKEFQVGDNELSLLKINPPEGTNKLFEVILQDSVLFPEGGGQPDDRGYIERIPVLRVVRRGNNAVHFLTMNSPFKDNQEVSVMLDWERRFDHMQQHSGQHLITAVAAKLFGFETTSWWLGTEDSYIELATNTDITVDNLNEIEDEVNLKIRDSVPVTVDVVELDSPKLKTARGRNLPEDVKGQIRIVTMDGVESNVCCGTHVSSLSQLQAIKLMYVERKKGKHLLHFLVGNRVLSKLRETFQREQKISQILKSCPAELDVAAEKLSSALKTATKCFQTLSKELAALEGKKFMSNSDDGKLWHYHRDLVELDFGLAFLRELKATEKSIVLITLKSEGNSGSFILRGSAITTNLEEIGCKLCEVLDGKGTLRGNVFQAKVSKINAVNKALKAIQDLLPK